MKTPDVGVTADIDIAAVAEMNAVLKCIADHGCKHRSLYLTCMRDDATATFGDDNIDHFHNWTLVTVAATLSGRIDKFVIMVREFQPEIDPVHKIPLKVGCACIATRAGLRGLSAEEREAAAGPEATLTSVDFDAWLRTVKLRASGLRLA